MEISTNVAVAFYKTLQICKYVYFQNVLDLLKMLKPFFLFHIVSILSDTEVRYMLALSKNLPFSIDIFVTSYSKIYFFLQG